MTMIAWDKDTAAMGKHFLKGNYKTLLVLGAVMTLIAVLATVMLVLLHTNEEIKRLQNQVEYAPVDYSVGGLSLGQVEALKKDTDVAHVSVQQGESYGYIKGEETVFSYSWGQSFNDNDIKASGRKISRTPRRGCG